MNPCFTSSLLQNSRVWSTEGMRKTYDTATFYVLLFNYLLKITIYSMYSIEGKSYKIVPITNLTKMSTWTKCYTKGKIKITLVKKTRKTLCLMVSWFYSSI
jgi:hypothetical protein